MLMNEIDVTGRIIRIYPYDTLLMIAFAGYNDYMEEHRDTLRASGRYIPNVVKCCDHQYTYNRKASLKIRTNDGWVNGGQLLVVYVREDRTEPISDAELKTAFNVFMGFDKQTVDLINRLSDKVDDIMKSSKEKEEI